MAGVEDRSEFDGGGVMPNTVYPKGEDALTNSDILRLQSLTGQDTDSKAPLNPYHWYGNMRPDPNEGKVEERARKQQEQAFLRQESNRYKESSPY